jgi:hypothetical protein
MFCLDSSRFVSSYRRRADGALKIGSSVQARCQRQIRLFARWPRIVNRALASGRPAQPKERESGGHARESADRIPPLPIKQTHRLRDKD